MIYELKINEMGAVGTIQVELVRYKERMKILKESGLLVDEEKATIDQLNNFDKIIDVVSGYVKKVDIKIDGKKITTLDDLEFYAAYTKVITQLSQLIFNGITLSEDLKKS